MKRAVASGGRIRRRGSNRLNITEDALGKLYFAGFRPDHIVDIGANVGDWSRKALGFFPDARIVMFEGSDHFDAWADLRFGGKVHGVHAVLDSHEHEAEWYASASFETGNSLYKERTPFFGDVVGQRVRTSTLDGMLRKLGYGADFKLIKLDVQGAELDVLKGGLDTLAGAEFVIIEMPFAGQYNLGAPSFAEYVLFMDRAGFVPFALPEVHTRLGVQFQIDITWARKGSAWEALVQEVITNGRG